MSILDVVKNTPKFHIFASHISFSLIMKRLLAPIFIAIACSFNALATPPDSVMAPVFIILGQSNADGSAMFDPDEDARLRQWYTSPANTGDMKIWYRSTKVFNQPVNALGEAARWVVDGDTTDMQPGWMNLWYRNENLSGRTAMNMIHGYGTYSTGTGTDCAQGRRGIEGQFGMKFRQAFPDDDLYIIKLGVSGSFISSWAHPDDNTNWDYFYRHIYRPAIEDLLAKGKRPYLAGIWWMQGCADMYNTKTYYYTLLQNLIMKCRTELGFPMGRFYIGHIVKPGESELYPHGSMSFSQDLRDAQDSRNHTSCRHYRHQGLRIAIRTLFQRIRTLQPQRCQRDCRHSCRQNHSRPSLGTIFHPRTMGKPQRTNHIFTRNRFPRNLLHFHPRRLSHRSNALLPRMVRTHQPPHHRARTETPAPGITNYRHKTHFYV